MKAKRWSKLTILLSFLHFLNFQRTTINWNNELKRSNHPFSWFPHPAIKKIWFKFILYRVHSLIIPNLMITDSAFHFLARGFLTFIEYMAYNKHSTWHQRWNCLRTHCSKRISFKVTERFEFNLAFRLFLRDIFKMMTPSPPNF